MIQILKKPILLGEINCYSFFLFANKNKGDSFLDSAWYLWSHILNSLIKIKAIFYLKASTNKDKLYC